MKPHYPTLVINLFRLHLGKKLKENHAAISSSFRMAFSAFGFGLSQRQCSLERDLVLNNALCGLDQRADLNMNDRRSKAWRLSEH